MLSVMVLFNCNRKKIYFLIRFFNKAYEIKKNSKYCVIMAYLLLKYCGKNVETYSGNLRHLTMSHRFFLKVVIDVTKMSMTFLVFAFFFA